ncbi:MAG: 2,3-bisphosphoglycerate-independent phosphoglycerate mutase [Candidatus Moranbacteria bacterium]|nr:2,3-bisphosphoglycerate-independent phosphoglycerate mutase [Candidatus Moranbacteria bacterium]
MKLKSPTLLIILDGWGVAPPHRGNAITLAKKPTIDSLIETYPSTTLGATGQDVGLEDNKMSGSEAGHMNIGAGRIVKQDSAYITESITDGSFFVNPALIGAVNHAKKNQSRLHIIGLMGDADSPHSDPNHFKAVLNLARKNGISEAYCHFFTDGRDSYPQSAQEHLKNFRIIMAKEGIGKIATIGGRFYGMDRAKNWGRLKKAYVAMVQAEGEKADSAEEAIDNAYKNKLTDEYVLPTIIMENSQPVAQISDNDAVIFFNLRSDRARQFTKFFVGDRDCILRDKIPVTETLKNLYFAAMTDFGPDLNVHTAYPGHTLQATLPMEIGGFKQLYISESEKFAHVTYFLNGGYADPVAGEERVMVPSPIIDSYAKAPEMAGKEMTAKIMEYLQNRNCDFITVNYPNADMVGHTGDLKATVRAVEFLDSQIKILAEEILKLNGHLIITADHGNADDMMDPGTDQPNTFHTKNPVPFILISEKYKNRKLKDGGVLGNIAPTILDIFGVEKPKLMDKETLIV